MKDKKTLLWIYKYSKEQLPFVGIIVVLRTALTILGVYFALMSKGVIDAATRGEREQLIQLGCFLILIILTQIIIKFIGNSLEEKIRAKLEIKFKSQLFSNIMRKDYGKITTYHSGDLLTRLSSDVSIVSNGVIDLLPSVVAMIAGLLTAFFALVAMDRTFAFVFVFGGAVLFVTISFFRKFLKRLHKRVQETDGKVRSFFQESILSLLMIKVFNVEEQINKKSEDLQTENYDAKMKRRNISITANTGLSFIFSFASLYALLRSSYRLYAKTITFGTLTAVLQLVNQIQVPIASLSGVLPRYFNILASAERIIEIEELPEEKSEENSLKKEEYENLTQMVFENITFSYDRECVIEDASCRIDKGDFVIISGISGIGKSTLMKLLLGVIYPEKGSIYLSMSDGDKIHAGKHIRKLFSYVPQGNLLMSGTIRESVSVIKPDATDEEIMKAAEVSCAKEFIDELPLGLDTVIGEKGAGLSEGQIQRLSVTRAILSGAPIILLDEATSALDGETEKKLLENIKNLKDKTCILISHKKAAYSICNKELKIENKKILTTNI